MTLLLHPKEAAAAIRFKPWTFYRLMRTNPDLRACVVEIPGVRGVRIHAEKFAAWADSLLKEKSA